MNIFYHHIPTSFFCTTHVMQFKVDGKTKLHFNVSKVCIEIKILEKRKENIFVAQRKHKKLNECIFIIELHCELNVFLIVTLKQTLKNKD